uniref:Uncharacterized protein n=1 Tax=Parascaris equorum TaxID=6256 RepID=A0A914REG2_PAREQ
MITMLHLENWWMVGIHSKSSNHTAQLKDTVYKGVKQQLKFVSRIVVKYDDRIC